MSGETNSMPGNGRIPPGMTYEEWLKVQTPIVYPEPIQAFRFLVKVVGDETISGAFTQFSGIRMTVETMQGRAGDDRRGVKQYTPVFSNYAPVTLSKGVVGDNQFLDWILAVAAGMEDSPTGKNLRRNIEIITLNDHGEEGVTWTLQNAMPIGYELSPMDSSRSEVLTESITFAITGMKRTTARWTVPKREPPKQPKSLNPWPPPPEPPRPKYLNERPAPLDEEGL